MYLAPGYWLLPLRTSSCNLGWSHFIIMVSKYRGFTHYMDLNHPTTPKYLSMLKGVTISGKVILAAMDRGTPTWSICRLGSGVMTVRAEKSTRLPMRLPRTRPSLPFRRCFMDLRGRPDFCIACEQETQILILTSSQEMQFLHSS